MRNIGLEVLEDQVIHATAYSVEEGNRSCAELLGRRGDLTAIVAANDLLAIGCYEALDGLGLRCPEDISVIGSDYLIENVVLLLIIQKFRDREIVAAAGLAPPEIMHMNRDDPLRVRIGEWIQQHIFDHAEDGRRRTDSQSQG